MHEIRRSKRHSYPSTYRTAWTRRLFPFFQPRTALSGLNRVIYAFSFPHGKDHPSIMDRSPISTRPGCGLCTYTPYPHLRLCMHHHISFRPKLAIVHSDIAGLQHEATLAIYQLLCFSSIAVIISSIMSISSQSPGCLKSSQVADMSYTKRILARNLISLQERNEQSFTTRNHCCVQRTSIPLTTLHFSLSGIHKISAILLRTAERHPPKSS